DEIMQSTSVADMRHRYTEKEEESESLEYTDELSRQELVTRLEDQMKAAAAELDFEKAAKLRDKILRLKGQLD
ncbi:MAG: UvrB/UvrC motif-containing protein, partial [Calditrichota bacterium]